MHTRRLMSKSIVERLFKLIMLVSMHDAFNVRNVQNVKLNRSDGFIVEDIHCLICFLKHIHVVETRNK